MTLSPGARLGPYEIVGQIGAGGMGEVYRAKDARLSRDVAIKVLPASFSEDGDRLRRFEQEAKAAGVLNHPNITAVYDIGEADGAPYVVQELLEGETLRATLAGGKLSTRRATDYAMQIAHGLAAAHDKGIVHRDLKPENLFVTKDGRVKILDFGLAKLTQPEAAAAVTDLPTETRGTEPGVVLGTLGYMSPEQVRGKPADARSDLFSFGAILYEMLSGRRAFHGDSAADTMSAILREDPPDLSVTNQAVPPGLERIVRHCLEKSPEQRFHSAHDVAFALEALSQTSAPGAVAPAAVRARRIYPPAWLIAGLAAGAAIAWLAGRRGTASEPRLSAFFTQLTSEPGIEYTPALSPDGKLLAYVRRGTENADIYVLRVGGTNPIDVTRDEPADDIDPAFSPDGSQIAFRSERQGGGIFLMGATGESVRRVTDAGFGPAWTPDGKEIVYATEDVLDPLDRAFTSELWSVEISSGRKRRLFVGDGVQPAVSPHGLRIAYWGLPIGSRRDIFTIPRTGLAAGEKPVPVTSDDAVDWNPVWSPDGKFLYFSSNRNGTLNLWRIPVDEKSGRPTGDPEPMTTPSRWSGFFSVSSDGTRIAYLELTALTNIERINFDPGTGKAIGAPTTILRGSMPLLEPDISPDGEWIVLRSSGVQDDLFLLKPDGSALRQLTSDAYRDRAPNWSPDGKRIVFHSDRTGRYQAWTIQRDGSGLAQLTHSTDHEVLGAKWSPDGSRIAWQDGDHSGVIDVSKPGAAEGNVRLPILSENKAAFIPTSWSPDGRSILGSSFAGARRMAGVWRYSLESGRYDRLMENGAHPSFLKDGRRFIFESNGRVLLHDPGAKTSSVAVLGSSDLFERGIALSPDNRWLCLVRDVSEGDVWMATLKAPGVTSDPPK